MSTATVPPVTAVPASQTPAVTPAQGTPVVPPVAGQQPAAPAPAKPAVSVTPAPQAGGDGKVPLAALMEERDKRQGLQSELESLRTQMAQLQQQVGGFRTQQPAAQPQQDVKAHLDKLWETDPRQAVQAEIMMAAQWMDNVNAKVDQEAAQLAVKYPDFNDYRNTAMGYVRSLPLEQRGQPGVVEMAYLVSRGQNVDKIIEAQRVALQQQFIQNPGMFQVPAGSGAPAIGGGQKPALNEDQLKAASAMGISPEEYAKYQKQ